MGRMNRITGVLVLLLALGLSGCSHCVGGKEAHLTKESDNPACRKELAEALEALRKGLGMNTAVGKADVDSLLSSGKVVKAYGRDGVQYRMHIMVRKKDGKCILLVGKRERSEPGKSSTQWGNYGSVTLNVCKCK